MADKKADEVLDDIRAALSRWDVRLNIVRTFSGVDTIQVESKNPETRRWQTIKTLIFPPPEGSLGDTLQMLADLRAESFNADEAAS
jgi:hypothetical protein